MLMSKAFHNSYHAIYICPDIILLISMHMCAPCVHHEEPLFLDVTPNSYLDSSQSF